MMRLDDLAPSLEAEINGVVHAIQSVPRRRVGRLVRAVGLLLEVRGLGAPLGALCELEGNDGLVEAEVVGFNETTTFVMPYSSSTGIAPGARVRTTGAGSRVRLSNNLLGRIVDGRGIPLDGKGSINAGNEQAIDGSRINPLERAPVSKVLDVGIKAINGALTIGQGQRIGLMAGSGVGKSVLLGMIARYAKADVVVIGLIGERGREVNDFIRETLGESGLAKSVVVAAPADVSPMLRIRATRLAHLVAEFFRDQGRNVLLLIDSLTRVAHAQREIGLAVGEPPTAKGYPPSVLALLPNLIERSGMGRSDGGSITAIYTVLMDNDDRDDPVVDIARASLDGQIMMSRTLADAAHYPAIDLSGSISRLMPSLVDDFTLGAANRFRRLWSLYQQNQDLIKVGALQRGANPELDEAVARRADMERFLCQRPDEAVDFESTLTLLNTFAAAPGQEASNV